MTLIHTPGPHARAASACWWTDACISGDTLFLDGCGRTDLPGSDPEEMYRTLTQRLSGVVSDDTVLFPGHLYSPDPSAPMGDVREHNRVLVPGERRAVARDVRAHERARASDHVVVVGAGLAGWRFVEALRRHGFDGAITLIGDETHAPYDRPPLSKQVLAGKWDVEHATLATPELIDRADVDAAPRACARRVSTSRRRTVRTRRRLDASTGTHVVIATGARARRLPVQRRRATLHACAVVTT